MQMIKKRIIFSIGVVIIVVGILFLMNFNRVRGVSSIKPGDAFESVVKILGEPTGQSKEAGMTLYYFKEELGAAGPIRVGFNDEKCAVYLKMWEDSPPEWDRREVK
jgi:hypothetical protein